jgi:cytochrome c5
MRLAKLGGAGWNRAAILLATPPIRHPIQGFPSLLTERDPAAILARLYFDPRRLGAAVSAEHDRKFFDTFMMVLGFLILIAVGLYILARVVAGRTQEQHVLVDPTVRAAVAERIAPAGKVAIAGQDNSALAPKQAEAAAPLADLGGEEVFNMACVACHGAGIAGAPKMGDAGAWAPRIAQGTNTLYEHSIKGFQGQAGFMPAKGGRTDLSDQSIINAVDFMVSRSK